jgi:hypothetical protein
MDTCERPAEPARCGCCLGEGRPIALRNFMGDTVTVCELCAIDLPVEACEPPTHAAPRSMAAEATA